MDEPKKTVGYITFVMCDEHNNEFVELGGAGFNSNEEWEREWEKLPAASSNDHTAFIADKEDAHGGIITDKPVTAETIEALIGEPIQQLIDKGRARNAEALRC